MLVVLAIGVVISACSRSTPSSDDKSWLAQDPSQGMMKEQGKDMGQGQMAGRTEPGAGPNNPSMPLTDHVIEWKSVGLSDDQIRRKVQEVADDPSIMPGVSGFDEAGLGKLRTAGVSEDLIKFFEGLKLPEAEATKPAEGTPAEQDTHPETAPTDVQAGPGQEPSTAEPMSADPEPPTESP